MISTLDELIAPLTGDELRGLLAEPEVRVVRRGDPAPYRELLDWDGATALATSGTFPARKLRITRDGRPLASGFFRDGDAPKADAIEKIMATHGSNVMYGLESYVPALGELCTSIAAELGEKVAAGAVQTAGPGGAVRLHYDRADVIAIQVEGHKRWLIGRDRVVNPVPGMAEAPVFDTANIMDVTLDPGDMLILPAGFPHHCENLGERSLHLVVFVFPMTALRVLDLLFRQMVQEPEARRAFRFAADDPAAQEELKRLVADRLRDTPFADLLAQHQTLSHMPAGARSSDEY